VRVRVCVCVFVCVCMCVCARACVCVSSYMCESCNTSEPFISESMSSDIVIRYDFEHVEINLKIQCFSMQLQKLHYSSPTSNATTQLPCSIRLFITPAKGLRRPHPERIGKAPRNLRTSNAESTSTSTSFESSRSSSPPKDYFAEDQRPVICKCLPALLRYYAHHTMMRCLPWNRLPWSNPAFCNSIVYDGVCNLCNGAVNLMLDLDPDGSRFR